MNNIKKILFIFASIMLVGSMLITTVSADDEDDSESQNSNEEDGQATGKGEVVYATLSPSGEQESLYVVNQFEIAEEGTMTDYGNYSSVKNLTDLSEVKLNGDEVEFTASGDRFYYQGNMENASLPWSIDVTYLLDGEEIAPDELAGQEGSIEIHLETEGNEEAGLEFFENYMLQITVPFDSEIFSNLQAPDGMMANAGKTQQVTFTVMPENEESFVVAADTSGFEFDGIEIAGVPSSMSIDEPETGEMTDDMGTLAEAIAELNDGVADLHDGVSELNDGTGELLDGSAQYQDGVAELSGSSGELVDGSKEIDNVLETMNRSLNDADEMDMGGQDQLVDGLNQLSAGLTDMKDGLQQLNDNYSEAFGALDGAMEGIPSNVSEDELKALSEMPVEELQALSSLTENLSEEELQALAEAGLDEDALGALESLSALEGSFSTIEKLVNAYDKSQVAKGTFFGTGDEPGARAALAAVESSLEETISGLDELASNVDQMADEIASASENMDGLTELQDGIAALAIEYETFHSGLVDYTGGVNELANSYSEVHSGIAELNDGTGELENGVADLQDGTAELHDSTKDLPEEMTSEIDEMISEYDKSDFDPVSFVSEKNENVDHVQFVLQTQSIEIEEPEEEEPEEEEPTGFWEKFKALFN